MLESELKSGIDLINSLLKPGTASDDVLTDDQKEGLNNLRTSLMKDSEENSTPKQLDCDNEEEMPDETKRWLLSEFGGIKKKNSKWNKVRNHLRVSSIIKRLKQTRRDSSREEFFERIGLEQSYGPDEWYNLEPENQLQLFNLLKWENIGKWSFDIFEVSKFCNGNPFLFIGWAILGSPYSQILMEQTVYPDRDYNEAFEEMKGYNFMRTCKVDQKVILDFLRVIESKYIDDVPFHNSTHGADVLQSTHAMLEDMNGRGKLKANDLQLFSLLVGAGLHDVGHPGYNNEFQMKTCSKLALAHNDKSVLENYHVSLAFRLIMGEDGNSEINIFKQMDHNTFAKCRKMIIEAVLATDMSNHFTSTKEINKLHDKLAAKEENLEDEDISWEVLKYLMHVCDISNSAKKNSISVQWTDRVLKEFFQQGDKEKEMGLPVSPLCDREKTSRAKSQLGFIDFIIKPSFESAAKFLPKISEDIMPIIQSNYKFWQGELEIEEAEGDENKLEAGTVKQRRISARA